MKWLNFTRTMAVPEDIHTTISKYIDIGKAICTWFDEFYVFYTPYYLKSHTNHVCVINKYNKDHRIYSILDINPLPIYNGAKMVNYEQFFCTYEVIENTYINSDFKNKCIYMVGKIENYKEINDEEQYIQFRNILKYLIETKQAGNDTETIYQYLENKIEKFDVNIIRKVYVELGKKELLIDTILNYFTNKNDNEEIIKELSYKVLLDSNKLVSIFVASMYRGGGLSFNKCFDLIQTIKDNTIQLFKEVLV